MMAPGTPLTAVHVGNEVGIAKGGLAGAGRSSSKKLVVFDGFGEKR